ncbi:MULTISPECIES: cell envelope integrity protein TolA [Ralstonia]|uniref:cell envelope integrity protein TolA n=1 Tax=Ralstonia TaxID=48736 RepID=UPI0004CF293D|nr:MULTISPECIES: cell envelope integrity protein TolA [Ralstonia]MBY4703429.1 cell envelope integrity protein TolA [Ralstonia insidiosa]
MATRSVSPALHRYEPVRERGTLRAFGLAVLTHLLLITFLYFGVQWQSSTPRGEEAELWDEAAVQQAVQTAPPPPEVKPEPVIKAPPTKVEEEADIALEQKHKREREAAAAATAAREAELARRAAEDRAEAQRQAQLKVQKEQQARQAELQRKAQAEQQAKEKAAAAEAQARKNAQLQAQAEAKAKADAEAKQKELKAKAAADAKAKADAGRKAAESKANAQRNANLARMQALAGGAGKAEGSGGGVGNAQGTGGTASAGYAERVRAKVKPNIVFDPGAISGNPAAVVAVTMAPDGSILSKRLTKSSGNGAYDEAVMRAVERSDPLPRDTNGKAPSSVNLTFRPKE